MKNIYYLPSHEYIKVDGDTGYVGISEYAASELGAVESRKAASDLFMPVDAEIIEINEALEDDPRLLNNAPLENWIVKVTIQDPEQLKTLMDQEVYTAYCATLH